MKTSLSEEPEIARVKADETPVVILADHVDGDLARKLFEYLSARCPYVAVLITGDGATSAEDLEAEIKHNLISCEAVLLVYGRVSPQWVQSQIRRIVKLTARRPNRPSVVVLVAPPPRKLVDGAFLAGRLFSGHEKFRLVDSQDSWPPKELII